MSFRIAFVVEDKHLAEVCHAISGLVINLEFAPTENTKIVKIGKKKQVVAKTDGSVVELFADWVHQRGLKEVSAKDVQEFARPGKRSYTTVLRRAITAGILKKTGKGRTSSKYRVLNGHGGAA